MKFRYLRTKKKNINIFYKIKDIECSSMILSGFKNTIKINLFTMKNEMD